MKSKNFIITILVSILVCVCVLQKNGIANNGKEITAVKMAVVDMEKLLVDGEKNEKFEKSFNADSAKIREELKNLEQEILDGRESLKRLKPTSQDYVKRGRELMQKEMSLEVKRKFVQQEFTSRRQRWLEMSFRSILKEIEKVAKAEGYDTVLAKPSYHWPSISSNDLVTTIQTAKVLYNSEEMDITDKVLESWNASTINF
jgi:outer membrane protein